MAICYRYDQEKKTFQQSEEMLKDPLESELQGKDIWLLPADCTLIEPPEAKEGFDIVWSGDAWEYKEQEKPKEEEPYIPTEDDLKNSKRWERDDVLNKTMCRIQRYQTQKEAGLSTTDDATTYSALLNYAQYLRDIPQQSGEWWSADILDFDVWRGE